MLVDVKIQPVVGAEDLPLPRQMTAGASGFDLLAAVETEVRLERGERKLIPTGIRLEMPIGLEAQVRPRSGLALKYGVTTLNSPGTIDADYRGEIGVILINWGETAFMIQRGERIAQLVFQTVPSVRLIPGADLTVTERGSGGFGHTGK
ncbi:deoxyuridine 5'-triphosphate nucleotidohydrolase [Desmospora activa DSM 45169]|uniref:Deoxyuridine 5'-triphosphate nucleotidohydrolase n=1 Tax=Desmospora activa DSM 45169 TaxID=1121389 RepID=A0A2T4ZAN6_9BACL|nr:dUTP diphosphatase [Desmospora activa]PTM58952.1 deoxyuridine 5'-triphosphate nucleotidohydrolase [Desmospora activa DSM 45169]